MDLGKAACVACHQRKIRCDARTVGLPCSNCRLASRPDCRLHVKRKRRAVRTNVNVVPLQPQPPPISASVIGSSPQEVHHPVQHGVPSTNSESSGPSPADSARQPTQDPFAGDCKTHLVEFIDQEDMKRRPIDQSARMAYVGTKRLHAAENRLLISAYRNGCF